MTQLIETRRQFSWSRFVGACFFTALLAFFVGHSLLGAIRQSRTAADSQTLGRIESIHRTEESVTGDDGEDDGIAYAVAVRYHYTVNHHKYLGTLVRYGDWPTSDDWAANFVASHAAGTNVAVYYDPLSPAHAVLIRGLEGLDFFLLLLLTPFVCFAILLWALTLRPLKQSGLAWMTIRRSHRGVVIRPSWSRVALAALLTAAIAAFILVFLIAFAGGQGLHPSIAAVTSAWEALAAAVALAALITQLALLSGRYTLLLDRIEYVVRLPRRHLVAPFSNAQRVVVRYATTRHTGRAKPSRFGTFLVQKGQIEGDPLHEWLHGNPVDAYRLANIVAKEIGCPASDSRGQW